MIFFLTFGVSISAQSDDHDDIFKIVTEMPKIRSCVHVENEVLYGLCLSSEVRKFLYGHPSYIDIEGDVQGIHIVRFTIEKDGELTDIEHLRSLGAQLNTVVDTIVKDMSAAKFYTAGVHNGDTVRIRYMLPLQIVPHNGEGVFPDPAYRVFESDFDYV